MAAPFFYQSPCQPSAPPPGSPNVTAPAPAHQQRPQLHNPAAGPIHPTSPTSPTYQRPPTYPNPSALAHDKNHYNPDNFEKAEHRQLHSEKVVTTLSSGLLSVLVITLSYVAVFATADIFRTTVAPLASTSILIVVVILAALYLLGSSGKLAKLATVSMLFAVVGGAMVILFNASSRALRDGAFVNVNPWGVILSAGVFGGLGLGVNLGFLLYAGTEEQQFPV